MKWIILLILAFVSTSFSQQFGEIRGTVYDRETNNPLPAASVVIVGTQIGSATDLNGNYIIKNVKPGTYKVQARFVGYGSQTKDVTVRAGETVTVDFYLAPTALQLDEIVVTGTGTALEKRSVGNTVGTVTIKDIEIAPVRSITEVLQGRVSGLVALPSSGQAGSAAAIRLRGLISVSQDNSPLIYVDGVRVDNASIDYGSVWTGGQHPSRLNDIIPADIERIEVIKGAAATTLYGTQAANGVIQIFTKKGITGQPTINFMIERGGVSVPKKLYSTGYLIGIFPTGESITLGARRTPDSVKVASEGLANSLLSTGPYEAYFASIRGGTPTVGYYVSGRYENEVGSITSNYFRRISFRGNLNAVGGENWDIQATAGYTYSKLKRPNNDNNIYGVIPNALLARRNLATTTNPYGEPFTPLNIARELNNLQTTHAFTGGVTWNHRPFGTFRHKVTIGFSVTAEENEQLFPYGLGFIYYPYGMKGNQRRTFYSLTLDYSLAWHIALTEKITSSLTAGLQGFADSDYRVFGQGRDFPAPGLSVISAGAVRTADEFRYRVINGGIFVQEQIGFANTFFITGALRLDGNSGFGPDYGLALYPKAQASFIASELGFWPKDIWNSMKLRAAWGQAGLAPGVFDKERTWDAVAGLDGVPAVTPGNIGNRKLKPERSDELEVGFDAGFFNDRLGIEFTYYRQITRDALLLKRYPPSEGWLNLQLTNVGEVRNKGIELTIRSIPVSTSIISLDVNFMISTNDNKVTSLGGTAPLPYGLGGIGEVREGYPINSFWGYKLIGIKPGSLTSALTLLNQYRTGVRTPNNFQNPTHRRTIMNAIASTAVVVDSVKTFLGNAYPKLNGSISATLTLFRRISVYAFVEWATKFYVYNNTARFMVRYNTYVPEIEAQQKVFMARDTVELEQALREWMKYDWRADALWVQKGDFIRLREIGISYTLPTSFTRFLASRRVTLTFSARNVALWTKYGGPDPQVNYAGTGPNLNQGTDFLTLPQSTRYIFSLSVEF
ncbi:MAG: SusC/RagA family TonB-linked outer membrane protein [Candidatus Kryptonium sp.]|nr:SusC/RagA family TonB-linked outer membrane protein [Candidatus Kryptonium sp.]MDW8109319.1 SusC/RagA family TonB-linked outer membrane protein [Candidatus Kryptonium sp.]